MTNIYVIDDCDTVAMVIAEKLMQAQPGAMVKLTPAEYKKLIRQDGIIILRKEIPRRSGDF